MAEEFSKPDDKSGQEPGTGFSNESDDNSGETGGVDITSEALKALQKRDESAQAHITQLESENEGLRTEKSELANALSSATTLDEVMTRMNDTGSQGGDTKVSPDEVADAVEARLQTKAQKQMESDNWDTVVGKLTETYGEWAKADTEVQTKAASLGMSVPEATALARRNPSVFYELFLPKSGNVAPQQSIKSAASGQTPTSHTTDSSQRDRQFYNAMRTSKNPQERDKYWTVENQAQMRRDLYGAE